ncbi:MAG: hypothetical protein ACYSPJ_04030 [Planctomycetota bacterium]|jgi:electron transport complex protein RnfC
MAEIRGTCTFPGGVHPADQKEFSEHCSIEVIPAPKQVSIPLIQHIGAPCQPLVAKRDTVTAGQIIGKSDAFVSTGR